jgi:hypothetical protein
MTRRIIASLFIFPACALFGASVTISPANARNACRVISLPRWKPAALPPGGYDWSHYLIGAPSVADWDFRSLDGGVLIGLSIHLDQYPPPWPVLYSPDRYAADLTTGRVRKASETEWRGAEPWVSFRKSALRSGLVMKEKDRLAYKGREYPHTGIKWPTVSEDASPVSKTENYLAVNSWDGEEGGGGDLPSFGSGGRTRGHYFVDVYDTNSGSLLLSVKGHFHDFTALPNDLFRSSAWISTRYYMLPLNSEHLNKLLICDASKAAAARQEQGQ